MMGQFANNPHFLATLHWLRNQPNIPSSSEPGFYMPCWHSELSRCMGGFLVERLKGSPDAYFAEGLAQDLGMSLDDANDLFYPGVRNHRFCDVDLSLITAEIAANTLEQFMNTGKVIWPESVMCSEEELFDEEDGDAEDYLMH